MSSAGLLANPGNMHAKNVRTQFSCGELQTNSILSSTFIYYPFFVIRDPKLKPFDQQKLKTAIKDVFNMRLPTKKKLDSYQQIIAESPYGANSRDYHFLTAHPCA